MSQNVKTISAEDFAWKLKDRGIVPHIADARAYVKTLDKKMFVEAELEKDIEQAFDDLKHIYHQYPDNGCWPTYSVDELWGYNERE